MSKWFVYILRCSDGTLYTGVTTDVERRVEEHNGATPKAARYTRARQPIHLTYYASCSSRSHACREELRIKGLRRSEKLHLIDAPTNLLQRDP